MNIDRLWECFNLTSDDASAVLCIQQGKCPICKRALDPTKMSMVGDHEHGTGQFRGFLCWMCNRALGLFGDNIERLQAAVLYLATPPAGIVLGARYGMTGRKPGKVPSNRRKDFHRRGTGPETGCVYRCGCRDCSVRPLKLCPVHGQPSGV